ncbi:MAG: Hsp20/alpha crystallin family protein [Chitinophagales bacterium]
MIHKEFKDLGDMIDQVLNEIPNFLEKTHKERKEAMRDFFNNDFDKHFDFRNRSSKYGRRVARMNVVENAEHIQIELSAAGRSKADFQINLEDNQVLVISAESVEDAKVEGATTIQKEWGFPAFKRTYPIPDNVDTNQISATYENGVLTVTLPKKKVEKKESIRIEVI